MNRRAGPARTSRLFCASGLASAILILSFLCHGKRGDHGQPCQGDHHPGSGCESNTVHHTPILSTGEGLFPFVIATNGRSSSAEQGLCHDRER